MTNQKCSICEKEIRGAETCLTGELWTHIKCHQEILEAVSLDIKDYPKRSIESLMKIYIQESPRWSKQYLKDYKAVGKMDIEETLKQRIIECNSPLFQCQVFRAQYERKKQAMQDTRYEQDKENAEKTETSQLTMNQLVEKAYLIKEKLTKTKLGQLDLEILRYQMSATYQMSLSMHKAEALRKWLILKYPNDF